MKLLGGVPKTSEEISATAIYETLEKHGVGRALESLCVHEGVISVVELSNRTGIPFTVFADIEKDWQFLQLLFDFFPHVQQASLRSLDKDYDYDN